MKKIIENRTLIGEVLLALLAISGLIRTILIRKNIFIILTLVVFFIFLVIAIIFKLRETTTKTEKITIKIFFDMISIIFASLIVYLFHNYLEIHFFIMVPIVGLVGAFFFSKYENPLYLGAFIGMTTISIGYFIIIISLSALLYFFFENAFSGFGGKLGSSAFFAGAFIAIFARNEITVVYNNIEIYIIILTAIIAGMLTTVIQRTYKLSTVLASAFVGLLGTSFLIFSGFKYGALITSVTLGASFIGMTVKENLRLYYILFVSLIFAFLYIYVPFNGIGGKLGFTAFLSVLIIKGVSDLINPYINKNYLV